MSPQKRRRIFGQPGYSLCYMLPFGYYVVVTVSLGNITLGNKLPIQFPTKVLVIYFKPMPSMGWA